MASPDLVADLHRRLPTTARAANLVDEVIALALASTANERAWGLINVAAALRSSQEHAGALKVLDAAIELRPEPRAELAAYTCAAAVHCDLNDYATARKVGEGARKRAVDEKLLRVLGRTYWALYGETKDDLFAAEAQRCFDLAERLAEPQTNRASSVSG